MDIQKTFFIKRFPGVYEEFFSTHDIVVSSCLSYYMCSGISWRSGAPAVVQKLPFRIYVGLRSTGAFGRITLGALNAFVPARGKFLRALETVMSKELDVQYIEQYCADVFGKKDFPGFTIDILQERVEDLCVDAGVTTLTFAAIGLLAKRWSPADLEGMATLSTLDFSDTTILRGALYRTLHTDVMRYHTDAFRVSAFGGSPFATVIASDAPIVYCTEERGGSATNPIADLFPMNVIGHSDRLRDLRWWGFRLDEVSAAHGAFPLDVAIINPVSEYQEYHSMSEHIDRVVVPVFDELAQFSEQIAQRAGITGNRLPVFLKESQQRGAFWNIYARAGTVINMHIIRALVDLYGHPHVSSVAQSFLEAISSSAAWSAAFIGEQSSRMRFLMHRVFTKAESVGVPIGLRSFALGKMDASVIVYSAKGSFRNEIEELVRAPDSGRWRFSLDYASWEHGYGSGGIQVDQYREKGIISPIVKDRKYVLIYRDSEGAISERFIKDIQESTKHLDLLIDLTSDELFIHGRPCTSDDLPTQKATLQVLDFLFNHLGQSTPNDQLPPSTYANYRNEFQGKIVSPLNTLLLKRIKKELGLNIHGKLTSFSVTWNPGKLRIGILKPL